MAKQQSIEKFMIAPNVLMTGYFATIDGRNFAVTRAERKTSFDPSQGKQIKKVMPGSVFEDDKATGKDYFENLTDKQIHILVSAGVITLTKEQDARYKKYLNELYK